MNRVLCLETDNNFSICGPLSFISNIGNNPEIVELKYLKCDNRYFDMLVVKVLKGNLSIGDTIKLDIGSVSGNIHYPIRNYYSDEETSTVNKNGINFNYESIIAAGRVSQNEKKLLQIRSPVFVIDNEVYWMPKPYTCSSGDGMYKNISYVEGKKGLIELIEKSNNYLYLNLGKSVSIKREIRLFKKHLAKTTKSNYLREDSDMVDLFFIKISDRYKVMSVTEKLEVFYKLSTRLNIRYHKKKGRNYWLSIWQFGFNSKNLSKSDFVKIIIYVSGMKEASVFYDTMFGVIMENINSSNIDQHRNGLNEILKGLKSEWKRNMMIEILR